MKRFLIVLICLILVGCGKKGLEIDIDKELKANSDELICVRSDKKSFEKIVLTFKDDKVTGVSSITKNYIEDSKIEQQYKNMNAYVKSMKSTYKSINAKTIKDGNIIGVEMSYTVAMMPKEFIDKHSDILTKTRSEYKSSAEKAGAKCSE